MKNYAEQTNYPQLFKRTYWGAFKGECDPVIIANRNKMVEEFGIVRIVNQNMSFAMTFLEHAEMYVACDISKYKVLVESRYDGLDMTQFGFTPYPPIYSSETTSWIRKFYDYRDTRSCLIKISICARQQIKNRW